MILNWKFNKTKMGDTAFELKAFRMHKIHTESLKLMHQDKNEQKKY